MLVHDAGHRAPIGALFRRAPPRYSVRILQHF
jgi:hypothetical protein